jgi:hypothetical protein
MCGVVPDILIMVLGSREASSVIRRIGGYTDGPLLNCLFGVFLCFVEEALLFNAIR